MTKPPDLSAFPIPRKGGAKPIGDSESVESRSRGGEGADPEAIALVEREQTSEIKPAEGARRLGAIPNVAEVTRTPRAAARSVGPPIPPAPAYGQVVATTVKLDENRYLRLMEAGRPAPGRLKRRTIQEMLIEALDEWFERRQL